MSKSTPDLIEEYWPAALIAIALVAPIFIDTIAHPELFMTIAVLGVSALVGHAAWRGRIVLPARGLLIAVCALIGSLALRGLFAVQPIVAFYGAYTSDGTLLWLVASAASLVGLYAWARLSPGRDRGDGVLALLVAIALYAAASGVAAWEWGSTDGVGGPASGFTPNSQYQLQLLTVGLTATLGWAALKRRSAAHLVAAAVVAVVIGANILETRSSVAPLALVVGAVYAGAVAFSAERVSERVFSAVGTAIVGIAGFGTWYALVNEATAARAAVALDKLGNGRGTLWSSAARIAEQVPLVGRGLAHATSVSRWRYTDGTFDITTTTDPHNLFLLLATGGGIIAIVAGLALLFTLQTSLVRSVRATERSARLLPCIIAGGTAAVFALSQFAFVYPVAWVLAAGLLGIALSRDEVVFVPAPKATAARRIAIGACIAVATFTLVAWTALPARIASLHRSANAGFVNPAQLLQDQLALVGHPWDVTPADAAGDVLAAGLQSNPEAAGTFLTPYAEKQALVAENLVWDARLAGSRLSVWAAQAASGTPDPAELTTIVDDAMVADPASGFWPTAGADLLAKQGEKEKAAELARAVLDNPVWDAQAKANADDATYERLRVTAGR